MSVVARGSARKSAKGLGPWLSRIAPQAVRGAVTIALLPDSAVKRLNYRFRGKNRATDVLSFPSDDPGERPGRRVEKHLGDIVIAQGVAARQARNMGHSVQVELRVLALHGLLHLLGYDHDNDDGRMARAEARLRRRAGLPQGLIARSS